MSDGDKQAAVNQIVEDGMININYQTGATFKGTRGTSFKVTNIENNKYPIYFELYNENGDVVYTLDKIERGYECTEINLDKKHDKGSFEWKIKIGYADDEGNVSSVFPINVTFE